MVDESWGTLPGNGAGSQYYNPRAINRAAIRKVLDDAFHWRRLIDQE